MKLKLVLPLLFCGVLLAQERENPEKYWDFGRLKKAPEYRKAEFPDSQYPKMQAILFDGVPYKGKPAPVFAYVGYPEGPVPQGGFPGIVMVHGGGGTAYAWAVKRWNQYGYAVIALDWYNQRPVGSKGKKQIPLEGGKRQDHVTNVGNIVLAHSLLRSLPNVNPDKTALLGLSWGSWYGAMAAAVDPRFKAAIEIYCGDRKNNALFTNGRFLHAAKIPMYWIAGTNDRHAFPETLQAAFDECPKTWNKTLICRLPHSHVGFRFTACKRVADEFLKGGTGLPKLGKNQVSGSTISAEILSEGKGIRKAVLNYTLDGPEKESRFREWKTIPAQVSGKTVSASIPAGTFQCFLSVYDELDRPDHYDYCCGSGDVLQLKGKK